MILLTNAYQSIVYFIISGLNYLLIDTIFCNYIEMIEIKSEWIGQKIIKTDNTS